MAGKTALIEKPKNWPERIFFLTVPSYSIALTQSHLEILRTKPHHALEIPTNIPKGPCQSVKITHIKDQLHPACGQAGLFAAKDLKPGSFILEYLGVTHVSSSASNSLADDVHANSDYDLSLDRESSIGIDADKMGTEARFVNDYRGIKDKPNAEFKEVWNPQRNERGMAVWVLPTGKSGKGKGIKKGEEILVSYGRGFWDARKNEPEIEEL